MKLFDTFVVLALATRSYGAAIDCTGLDNSTKCVAEVHCEWDGTSKCSKIVGGVPTQTDIHPSWETCRGLLATCNKADTNPECQKCATPTTETCIPSNYILAQIEDGEMPLTCSTQWSGQCSGLYTQSECLESTTLPCKWIAQNGGGSCYHVKENPGALTPVYQPGHTTTCQPTTAEACPYTDGCALCTGLAAPLANFNGCTSALYAGGINEAQPSKCVESVATTTGTGTISPTSSTASTSSPMRTTSSTATPSTTSSRSSTTTSTARPVTTTTTGPKGSQGSGSVLSTTTSFDTPAFIGPFSIAIVPVVVSMFI